MGETKEVLKNALMSLLEERSLDKITVNEIVKEGHVNRNTFYYHFDDVYDLIDYLFKSEAKSIVEIDHIADEWEDDILRVTRYLINHKAIIYHLYFSMNRERLEIDLYHLFYEVLKKIAYKKAGSTIPEKQLESLIDFYTYGLVGKTLNWIKNDMHEDPEEFITQLKLALTPLIKK